jgi:hypothetical protein
LQCRTPSFNDVFGSNVDSVEVDFDVSYFGISLGGQNVVEQASQSTKGSKKRSKDLSIKEDNMLVLAWLEVGM